MDRLDITIRNTHFTVTTKSKKHERLVDEFNSHLITYKTTYMPRLKKYLKAEDRRYYYKVSTNIYHYSIVLLNTFIKRAVYAGISRDDTNVSYETEYRTADIKCKVRDNYTDRDHQPIYIEKALNTKPMVLVDLKTGKGKAHPLTSKILTPTGFKLLGDLTVNDSVITPKGTSSKVKAIYRRGLMEVYTLQFSNGGSANATGDHLWEVMLNNSTPVIKTTKELISLQSGYEITLKTPTPYNAVSVVDANYTMVGLLSTHFEEMNYNVFKLTTNMEAKDFEHIAAYITNNCIDYIEDYVYVDDVYKIVVTVVIDGNTAKACAECSSDKLSIQDRIDYIRGSNMLSTTFLTGRVPCSDRLRDVVLSLGGHYRLLQDGTMCGYVVSTDYEYPTAATPTLTLLDITQPSSEKEEVACIAIEDPDKLYIVDDYIPTHNTYISMRVATELHYTTGIVILPRYIDKWKSDLKELTTVKDEDIYVVQGGDSLLKLLDSDINYDFVIFSLTTLRNYIKNYDESPESYDVAPEDIFSKLGLGMLLNDEVHQSFHAVYMTMIRLNPLRVLSLSATLDNFDVDIKRIYSTLFPDNVRCGNLVAFDNHPIVKAVNYRVGNINRIQYMGTHGYSHVGFEQGMLRNSVFRKFYLEMILFYVNRSYVNETKQGDKLLILVQTIKFATLLTNYLKAKLNGYIISRYVEEDPYENIIESDITVSTNQSAGTALDIPNLISVIQTVSMRSLQANVQALGRLREIKGRDVVYTYIYTSDISSHVKLHHARKKATEHLAKKYTYEEYPVQGSC